MLAFKLQMPVNHPEESIQHSEHGESLKSSVIIITVITLQVKGMLNTRKKGFQFEI
jgi:hypothetical protein